MIGYIYITFNLKTKEIYVGKKKSSTFIATYYGSGLGIKAWIVEHGTRDLVNAKVDTAETEEELNRKEKQWIALVKQIYGNQCLNYAEGGDGGNVQKYWTTERKTEFRMRMSSVNKDKCTESVRRNMSEGQKRRFSTEESREAWSAVMKESWNNDELRKSQSTRVAELWENEEYRKMMHEVRVKAWDNDERRSKMSETQKKIWTPEKREEQSERLKQYYKENPDKKEKLSEAGSEYWKDQKHREEQSQKRKEYLKNHVNHGTEAVKVPYIVILNGATHSFGSRKEMEMWFKEHYDFTISPKVLNKMLENNEPYKAYYKKFKFMDGMMIYKGNKGVTTIENTSGDRSE